MKTYLKTAGIFLTSMLMTISCNKDDDGNPDTGAKTYGTTFKMTDAPIDNANVEAVFVTVSDVKVDGTSLEGFNRTTFDLSALVGGKTETLGDLQLEAGSYSNIVLELDYATDAAGNAPGCYVETANGEKDKLEASTNAISITDTFEVFATGANEIVIDFDLRKTVREEQGTVSGDFEFVSMAELSAGIRTVNGQATGKISGTANDAGDTSDKIVVYAYEKGTFDAETETKGSGQSNVTFAKAVTSSQVRGAGNSYSLDFLAEGDYELVFVSYTRDGDGFFFSSVLEVESATGLDLGAISVTSAIQISANVTVTGTRS